MTHVDIVRAIVHNEGDVLVLQNSEDDPSPYARGKWELPGGWVEHHDDHDRAAVKREIREETGLDVNIEEKLERIIVDEDGDESDAQLFLAAADSRDVTLSDEHQAYRWIIPEEYRSLDWLHYAGYAIPVVERVGREFLD